MQRSCSSSSSRRRGRRRSVVIAFVPQALPLDLLEDKVHPGPCVLVGRGVAVGGVGVSPVDLQEPIDDSRGAVVVAARGGAVSPPKVATASFRGAVQRHGSEGGARVGEADDVPGVEPAAGQGRAGERGREGERRRRRRWRCCCFWWWC